MVTVSVVIPCYRHERYVAECLESVFGQSYPEIELIVIDDCSPDRTYEIVSALCGCARYQERFAKLTCLRNETNEGAHATFNKGVSLAGGEYIALLNSDDQYHPERIASLMEVIQEKGGELAFSNFVFVDDDNREVSLDPLYCDLQASIALALSHYPALGFVLLQKQIALSTGNFLFSRQLFDRVGGFHNLKYCHDLDFILQALRYCEPLFLNRPLYRYRLHGGNSFRALGSVALAEVEFCLSRYFAACHFQGVTNPLAPCPTNWPGLFELFLSRWELEAYYTRAITGYYSWHKVVDPSAHESISARLTDLRE